MTATPRPQPQILDATGHTADFKALIREIDALTKPIAQTLANWIDTRQLTLEQRELAIDEIQAIVATEIAMQVGFTLAATTPRPQPNTPPSPTEPPRQLTVADLKDALKGLTPMERYRLYMGVWVPPEDAASPPTADGSGR